MAAVAKIRIATCRDAVEVALVRAVLGGHGISAHVAGEHHAALFGGLAGTAIPLHVWVDAEDAELAAELIGAMREDAPAGDPAPDDDFDEAGGDFDRDLDGDLDASIDPRRAIERRRRTALVLFLSCTVTFGTGHLYVGARTRALVLAAVEAMGIVMLGHDPSLGVATIAVAVIGDTVGAIRLARRDPVTIPQARLKS